MPSPPFLPGVTGVTAATPLSYAPSPFGPANGPGGHLFRPFLPSEGLEAAAFPFWNGICCRLSMIHPLPGQFYQISYRDAGGQVTLRRILVIEHWEASGEFYLRAWCFLRGDERIFRMDRIMEAALLDEAASGALTAVPAMAAAAVSPPAGAVSSGSSGRAFAAAGPAARTGEGTEEKPEGTTAASAAASAAREKKDRSSARAALLFVLIMYLLYAVPGYIREHAPALETLNRTLAPPRKADPPPRPTEGWKNRMIERSRAFRAATGNQDSEVLKYYIQADTNYDDVLSWPEIGAFQKALYRDFTYQYNDTALRPDKFVSSRGGDCEDWALFTCGLLTFWGYTSYVGSVDGNGGGGHALTLFYKKTKPANHQYHYYYFPVDTRMSGLDLPAGYYLPIDYNHTGTFSSASIQDSPLRWVYEPRSIYDQPM